MVYFKTQGERGNPAHLIPFVYELGVEVDEFSPQHRLVWLYLTFGNGQRAFLGESRDGYYATRQYGYSILRQIHEQIEKNIDKPNYIVDLVPYSQLMNEMLHKKVEGVEKDDD